MAWGQHTKGMNKCSCALARMTESFFLQTTQAGPYTKAKTRQKQTRVCRPLWAGRGQALAAAAATAGCCLTTASTAAKSTFTPDNSSPHLSSSRQFPVQWLLVGAYHLRTPHLSRSPPQLLRSPPNLHSPVSRALARALTMYSKALSVCTVEACLSTAGGVHSTHRLCMKNWLPSKGKHAAVITHLQLATAKKGDVKSGCREALSPLTLTCRSKRPSKCKPCC